MCVVILHTSSATHFPPTSTTITCLVCLQLEEIWIASSTEAKDLKVVDECVPGKPISVFLSESPKVRTIVHFIFVQIR